jgi:hypothetical protein
MFPPQHAGEPLEPTLAGSRVTNLVKPFDWYCAGPDHVTDAEPIPENVPVIDPPEHD